jgi:hypothetical protein
MQNRKLIWIAAAALTVAAAAHFRSHPWDLQYPSGPSASTIAPAVQKAVPASKSVSPSANPAEQRLAQVRAWFAEDPSDQNGRATSLLNELCLNGEFQTALQLVEAVPTDMRSDWLKIIFNRWAQSRPKEAMQSVDAIRDPDERTGAFTAAVAGWNSTDPASLANYALNLAAPDGRDYALSAALDNWSLQDPIALATWLNSLPRGEEFDYGAALMISKTDGANRAPDVAMKWVENIENPALKQNSFARVLAEWSKADSAAAKQYVATAAWLDDSYRSKILDALTGTP